MKKLFMIIALFLLTGCATLGRLADEVREIEPAEAQSTTESVSVLIDEIIPEPYKTPAAVGVGYLLALIRRRYKKKKGCQT